MNILEHILDYIPQQEPFRFVDEIFFADETRIAGSYTFPAESWYYKGHFPDRPVTPGVILTETMAQTGLVAFGIYLMKDKFSSDLPPGEIPAFVFTSSEVDFLKVVLPGEKVLVEAEKIYFRLGKLKVNALMKNSSGETVCKGMLAGMMIPAHKLEKK